MSQITSREIRLASRPSGWPTDANFATAAVTLPPVQDGQVLVRNLLMSVDPYMRGRMNDVKSYVPPFQVGAPLEGTAVGEVVESRAAHLPQGTLVLSNLGWREAFVADTAQLQAIDPDLAPPSAYLGVLGITGMTAWVGLELVDVAEGDVIWVSAAAGAVGSIAGQLAALRGCRVIGSAGSAEKVALLEHELGFDAAFNYKDGRLVARLHRIAPEGIDVYFDNVGGEHLEAALTLLRPHGRIVACGAISLYNDEAPSPGPRNLALVITKRLTIKGFIVTDWLDQRARFLAEVGGLLQQGKLVSKETEVDGLENAPHAFLDMLAGGNIGKMIVRLGT